MKKLKAIAGSESTSLKLGAFEIPCYVLENEERVVSGRGMQKALGFSGNASGTALNKLIEMKLLRYLDYSTVNKFKKPFAFDRVGKGGSAPLTHGFDATILIDICDALIQANRNDDLTEGQEKYAVQAETIIRSVAKVGIIALIDEATGYEKIREKNTLHQFLDKFLNAEARKWSKTFPDEFWEKLIKVKGHASYRAIKRPSYVGHWVNDIVYDRLGPGVTKELKKRNPRTKGGRRKKNHSFLSEEVGIPGLKDHLIKVMALMDASSSGEEFNRMLNRALPTYKNTKT